MCDEAVNDSLAALRLIPDWSVILMKILVMLYLIIMKWVLLILILIILIVTITLMKKILIRLFWLGILNLKNANNFNTRLHGILKDGGIGACQKMRKWK